MTILFLDLDKILSKRNDSDGPSS